MNRKLAVFLGDIGNEIIGDDTWEDYNDGEYVRQTEYVDVDFPDRDKAEIVPEQVARLEDMKETLQTVYLQKQAEIDEKISKLLAITHQE